MENASKALIIAGSIFLAIALITFGVYTYQSLHNMANAQDEKDAQEQLVAFNKKYEAYNKSIMYGTDVITVMNMAKEDNKMYGYNITMSFTIKNTGIYVYNKETKKRVKKVGDEIMGTDIEAIKADSEMLDDFKRRIFKCTNVEYDNKTGRIKGMSFTEQELTEEQYTRK